MSAQSPGAGGLASNVKLLLLVPALMGAVACGDATPEMPLGIVTVTPSPPAKASPVAVKTVLKFVNAPLTVAHGHNATLHVTTARTISCSIEVDYAAGSSTAAGLDTKTSDSAGRVSWTWKVGANTTRGSWPITVTCGSGSGTTHITVT